MTKNFHQRGLTLLELTVVVAILVVLASVLLLKTEDIRDDASKTGENATMNVLREALQAYLADMKFTPDFDPTKVQIGKLLVQSEQKSYDVNERRGWRGPYFENVRPIANTDASRHGHFPEANDRRFNGDLTFLERHFYETASSSPYGKAGDAATADRWGNPFVIQAPSVDSMQYIRIVSAGPDGVLTTNSTDNEAVARGDDIVIFINRADVQ